MKLVMTDGSYFEGTVEEMIAIGKAFASTPEATSESISEATLEEAPLKVGDIVVITGNANGSVNAVGDIGRIVDRSWNDSRSLAVSVPGRPQNSNYTEFSEMRRATASEREIYLRMEGE